MIEWFVSSYARSVNGFRFSAKKCNRNLLPSLISPRKFLNMRLTVPLLFFIFFASVSGFAQTKYTVSGYVKDAVTGEYIIGASVYMKETGKGGSTNTYGFYSVSVPEGEYTLAISFIGMKTYEQKINLTQNLTVNAELSNGIILTEAAEVVGEKSANTESPDMGRVGLEIDQIKTLPAFMGEVDILKVIQYLPGIQSAGEGNTGFYVRGGGVDQNLILLDNTTVYNASHLFGFFSVFNADAIKNLEIIKGGMPANHGGRLASVLDINLREGNTREHKAQGGIGLIASRITLEGPIKRDTASYIVSARRTYIDALIRPFIKPESNFSGTGYYFYDLNAKVNYRFSPKDQIYLSGYFGRDVFNFSSASAGFSAKIPWGNATGSLRWNHLFNDKLFFSNSLTFTDYKFAFEAGQEQFVFKLFSGIQDYGLKSQLSYYPNVRHTIKAGVDYTYHIFTPSSVTARSGDTEFDTGDIMKIYAHEAAAYVMDDFDITELLRVHVGFRLSAFQHTGPYTKFIPGDPADPLTQISDPEIIEYERGDNIKTYINPEPRLSLRYTLNSTSSVKAAYTWNYQYVHLASLSPTSLPTDIWIPSTDRIAPQKGIQYSIGYFKNLFKDQFETSVELYYKDMFNLIEYKDGVQPEDQLNNNVDNLLTFGRGYSYGAEFFLKRKFGKFNGWVGYTWSKTFRIFEDINNGDPFPARFDRRHDMSIVLNYELNPSLVLSGVFVYATGNAITLPESRYFVEGNVVSLYGDRNSFRMAPYHRADLSVQWTPSLSKKYKLKHGDRKKRVESHWNFSVYNLYNRMNPYFIYFGAEGNAQAGTLQIKAYQVSLFPIIPSVTWNFKF